MIYNLIELFNTIQGEGSTQGLPVTLVRFPKCCYACPWCDSKKTMNMEPKKISFREIMELVNISGNLLITGGEPTLYIPDIIDILYNCYDSKGSHMPYRTIFETNGYRLIDLCDSMFSLYKNLTKFVFSWSPKFYNDRTKDISYDLIKNRIGYVENVEMKLVIDPDNFNTEMDFMKYALCNGFDKSRIWLMPMGATYDELIKNLYRVTQICADMGVNLSPRLHIVFGKNLDVELNRGNNKALVGPQA
jgi:organic radical activating enzyme